MSINQLWAAYEEAQAAEYAALDGFLAECSEATESAWEAAKDATTAAWEAVMAARAARVPETIEDMAARVMGELAHEQRGRKIAIKRWSLVYAVITWAVGDYHAYGAKFEVLENPFKVHREYFEQRSRTAVENTVLYRIAERERMRGLVFGNERPALSLTPLAKVELDATWLEDASRAAGLDFAWMG